MIGTELFPISKYYQDNIIEAITISRSGGWWTAVLLINDPNTMQPMISFYKWNKVNESWKVKKNFNIRSKKDVDEFINALNEFRNNLKN